MNDIERRLAGPHSRARREQPPSYPRRYDVPDDKVSWDVPFPEYDPPYFVDPNVLKNDVTSNPRGWAEPENLDRVTRAFHSLEGTVRFDAMGRPLNPRGRTGISGRGLLGKWGANFAADPILTRGDLSTGDIEVLLIKRRDSGIWAFPGGMVDAGESATAALARELKEETGITADMKRARVVYRGYVDGRRNTDNAWIETVAAHLHLSPATRAALVPRAGDDAKEASWHALGSIRELHDGHELFLWLALGKQWG